MGGRLTNRKRLLYLRRLCLTLAIGGVPGCAEQSLPSWLSSPTSPSGSSATVTGLSVQPRALNGGGVSQGTVTLNAPAATSTIVTLSASDSAAVVPRSITVPAGASSATFPITTQAVPRDSIVTIGATAFAGPYQTTLIVWPVTANNFWYEMPPNGSFGRYSSDNATLTATCSGSRIDFRVNGFEWTASVGAVNNLPLNVGTYEDAGIGTSGSRPSLSVRNDRLPLCLLTDTVGRFTVEAADLSPNGIVRQFVATFEQSCRDRSATLRGEIRVVNPPPSVTGSSFCVR